MSIAFCTIFSKKDLAHVRVLAHSLKQTHPDSILYALLLGHPEGCFDPKEESFTLVTIEDLSLPNQKELCCQYDIDELKIALKASLFKFVFSNFQINKLIYLDPDIEVYQPMTEAINALDQVSIVLTPKALAPYDTPGIPNDNHLLIEGVYNLGFMGLSATQTTADMLEWWEEDFTEENPVSMRNQRCDFMPILFENSLILKNKAYHVSYYNLHERSLSFCNQQLLINESPCVFFHFKGYDPSCPQEISKNQTRFDMKDLGESGNIYKHYGKKLIANGYLDCSKWSYSFDPLSHDREIKKDKVIVNLIGVLSTNTGTGETSRAIKRILQKNQVSFLEKDIAPYDYVQTGTIRKYLKRHDSLINLVCFNADTAERIFLELGLKGAYNIGYWAWELETFPQEWDHAFNFYDEIWALSEFVAEALRERSPVPVFSIPLNPLRPQLQQNMDRRYFGLDPTAFLFLFAFDFKSFKERKNPDAVIKAFTKAFSKEDPVQLVLKCHGGKEHFQELLNLTRHLGKKCVILMKEFSREEMGSLICISDCVVSLHRAEGFGLLMAEAMAVQKPVIATGYSGNLEFMTPENSYLVSFKKIPIEVTAGPYKKGEKWADPDISHAASLMRRVYSNRQESQQKGIAAAKTIETHLNEGVAKKVMARLEAIQEQLNEF